jgi:hypothetical protein
VKYLTDSQTSALFVALLLRLGWDVETVYQHGIDKEPEDYRVLGWARAQQRTLITFDQLRGQPGIDVLRELRDRGGKLIQVGGGPQQAPERALGRLLFHYPDWHPWLEQRDGRVQISDTKHNCRMFGRREPSPRLRKTDDAQFDPYLDARAEARKRPIKRIRRRVKVQPEQGGMMLYDRPKKQNP